MIKSIKGYEIARDDLVVLEYLSQRKFLSAHILGEYSILDAISKGISTDTRYSSYNHPSIKATAG